MNVNSSGSMKIEIKHGRVIDAGVMVAIARFFAQEKRHVAVGEVALNRARDLMQKRIVITRCQCAFLHFVDQRKMTGATLLLQKKRTIALFVFLRRR